MRFIDRMLVTDISVRVDMTEMGVGMGVLMSDRSIVFYICWMSVLV